MNPKYKGEFKNGWRGEVGVCGPGSEEKYAKPSRDSLRELCKKFTTPPSIIEIGCGDTLWLEEFLTEIPPLYMHYLGLDLHERPEWKNYEPHAVDFLQQDILDEDFKLPSCDIIIARNLFIHLNNEAVLAILIKCLASGLYLLTSNDNRGNSNQERHSETFNIRASGLDLTKYPFSLQAVEGVKNAFHLK